MISGDHPVFDDPDLCDEDEAFELILDVSRALDEINGLDVCGISKQPTNAGEFEQGLTSPSNISNRSKVLISLILQIVLQGHKDPLFQFMTAPVARKARTKLRNMKLAFAYDFRYAQEPSQKVAIGKIQDAAAELKRKPPSRPHILSAVNQFGDEPSARNHRKRMLTCSLR